MKKILMLGIIFSILAFKYTYEWAPNNARNNGSEFANECDTLNGKPFTFEDLSIVNGYYDLNGKERLTRENVEQLIKQNSSYLRIYKDSWFKGPNIKYSWICEITYTPGTMSIIAKAMFAKTD